MFNEKFMARRKKEYDVLNQKMINDSDYQFRGMRYKDIVYGLFQLFSVIDFKDINEAKTTGLLNVRNRDAGEVVGAMYNREYYTEHKKNSIISGREVPNCYDIEIIIKNDMVNDMMPLIEALNEYCDGVDLVVESEAMPEFTIFIWESWKRCHSDLVDYLAEEFGGRSHFVFSTSLEVTHDDEYKLKKIMAVPDQK